MDVERPGLFTSWNHGAQGAQDVAGTPRTAALGQEVREGAHPGICRPTTKEEPFPGPSSVLHPGDCPLGAGATVYLPRAQGCSQHPGLSLCPEPGEACPGRTRWRGRAHGTGQRPVTPQPRPTPVGTPTPTHSTPAQHTLTLTGIRSLPGGPGRPPGPGQQHPAARGDLS